MKVNKETFFVTANNVLCFIEYHRKLFITLGIGAVCLILMLSIRGCEKKNKLIDDLKNLSAYNDSISASKVKEWKDKYGNEHARVENLVIESEAYIIQLDSIAGLLKIKPKEVTATNQSKFEFKLDGKLHVDTSWTHPIFIAPTPGKLPVTSTTNPPTQDSIISSINFSWKDAWTNINGTIGDGRDSIHITGNDTLKRTDYWKRKWLLGKKIYYSDFTNSNPHVHLTGYKGLQFADNSKKWSIGITAIIGYPTSNINISKPSIYFGIGVQRTLFKF